MRAPAGAELRARLTACVLALCAVACAEEEAPPPPCDARCEDGVAMRALRETLKLVYNLTLQGKPVGEQDATTPCSFNGSARVYGHATSNPEFGATEVDLRYELQYCAHAEFDEEPEENYEMGFLGVVTQQGTLAVQPSATTALLMHSDAISMIGTVHDPPRDYAASDCALDLAQSGNDLAGTFCERSVGVDLGGQQP
jgi:hypothetical protein